MFTYVCIVVELLSAMNREFTEIVIMNSCENLQKDFIGLSLSGENGEEVGFDEENEEYQYEKTPVGNEIEI